MAPPYWGYIPFPGAIIIGGPPTMGGHPAGPQEAPERPGIIANQRSTAVGAARAARASLRMDSASLHRQPQKMCWVGCLFCSLIKRCCGKAVTSRAGPWLTHQAGRTITRAFLEKKGNLRDAGERHNLQKQPELLTKIGQMFLQPVSSFIGLALLSTMRTGRPMGVSFFFV